MHLPKAVVRLANAITNFALLVGIPRPPYARRWRPYHRRRRGWCPPTGSAMHLRTTVASGSTFVENGKRLVCDSLTLIQKPIFAA